MAGLLQTLDDGAIDAAYQAMVVGLPDPLQQAARRLSHRLRLTQRGAGEWSDYVRLPPLRDLPSFAAEDPDGTGRPLVAQETLARFREAHLRGGFHGLLLDRISDGQVDDPSGELQQLAAWFFGRWRDALAVAVGDCELASGAVANAMRACQIGLAMERTALRRGRLSISDYVTLVTNKVGWLGVTSICLLGRAGHVARISRFHRVFSLLMIGIQLLDDAHDKTEDARLHGIGFPAALGYPPEVLMGAAPHVLRMAETEARAGGFHRFAHWLEEHAAAVAASPMLKDCTPDAHCGAHLCDELERAWPTR